MNEIRKPYFYCPRCKAFNVWEFEMHIYCPNCMLTFKKTEIQEFSEDNVLAVEELNDIIKLFDKKNIDIHGLFD